MNRIVTVLTLFLILGVVSLNFGLNSVLTNNKLLFTHDSVEYGLEYGSGSSEISIINNKTLFSNQNMIVDTSLTISGHATTNALITTEYFAKRIAFCYAVTQNANFGESTQANQQIIPSTGSSSTTIIEFTDGVNIEAGSSHRNPSNTDQFLAPIDGYYYIQSTLSIGKHEANATSDTIQLAIFVNGASTISFPIDINKELGNYTGFFTATNGLCSLYSISGVVELHAGDLVDIRLVLTDFQYYVNQRVFSGFYLSKLISN